MRLVVETARRKASYLRLLYPLGLLQAHFRSSEILSPPVSSAAGSSTNNSSPPSHGAGVGARRAITTGTGVLPVWFQAGWVVFGDSSPTPQAGGLVPNPAEAQSEQRHQQLPKRHDWVTCCSRLYRLLPGSPHPTPKRAHAFGYAG